MDSKISTCTVMSETFVSHSIHSGHCLTWRNRWYVWWPQGATVAP